MERTYVTTSLEVARVANRKHGQVLRDIERLRVILPDTKAPEFEAARRTDAKGNSLRYYNLTSYALALLDVGPVSYTHLDVYKRQSLICDCRLRAARSS